MYRVVVSVVLSALVTLVVSQCPGQKDFPAEVQLGGRTIYCTPTPPYNDTCEDPENYYICNNMRVDKADKSAKVRFDLFDYVPDEQSTNPIRLCIDMVAIVDKNSTVDSAAVGLSPLADTAYYNNDGWAQRSNAIFASLTCVTA